MILVKMGMTRKFVPVRSWAFLCLTLICLLIAGCAEVNYLRDAQSAFNEAAKLENEKRSTGTTTEANNPLLESEIRAGYLSAIASLDKLDDKQVARLKSDNLWGVVLAIRGMSFWRLGAYDEMEKIANQAKQIDEGIYPRDRAILLSLPALRRIDEAKAIVDASITTKDGTKVQEIKGKRLGAVVRLVRNASEELSEIRSRVSEKHPIKPYLIQSELAGYRNLLTAIDKFQGGRLSSSDLGKVKHLLKTLNCSFKYVYGNDNDLAVRQMIVLEWQDRFGLLDYVLPSCDH